MQRYLPKRVYLFRFRSDSSCLFCGFQGFYFLPVAASPLQRQWQQKQQQPFQPPHCVGFHFICGPVAVAFKLGLGPESGGRGQPLGSIIFWLWFGSVWFRWVGLVRFVSGLCLARKRETRLQSPRRFVLCDHHYLRFAASFYGVRVKGGAGEGVGASQRCRRIAAIAIASSYYNLPKTSTVFQYSTLRRPKKTERYIQTHTRGDDVCLKVVVKFHYWVSFVSGVSGSLCVLPAASLALVVVVILRGVQSARQRFDDGFLGWVWSTYWVYTIHIHIHIYIYQNQYT